MALGKTDKKDQKNDVGVGTGEDVDVGTGEDADAGRRAARGGRRRGRDTEVRPSEQEVVKLAAGMGEPLSSSVDLPEE